MFVYDAFMSYSHSVDNHLAPQLQQALQRFAKPIWRLRSLRIFRDETSLAASHALPDTLKTALDQSRYFLLLASPAAAQSKWVCQEVQYWLTSRNATSLIIVLTEGEIVWNDATGDFDWIRTTAVPKCLRGAFASVPKWEDLTRVQQVAEISPRNPRMQRATASVFSAITGRALDDVIGEDLRVHRRNKLIFINGVAAIILALALFIYQFDETRKEQKRFSTVIDLLAISNRNSALLMPDTSNVENPRKPAVEVIRAARNIARRDLSTTSILWIDDHPENNHFLVKDIQERLTEIGAQFEQSPHVFEALELLKHKPFDLVISNYGKDRCSRGGNTMAIAECVLDGVRALSHRPPVLIYAAGVTPEQADMMKCRGAVADTSDPDLLFGWIVRGVDKSYSRSDEIESFCAAHASAD